MRSGEFSDTHSSVVASQRIRRLWRTDLGDMRHCPECDRQMGTLGENWWFDRADVLDLDCFTPYHGQTLVLSPGALLRMPGPIRDELLFTPVFVK